MIARWFRIFLARASRIHPLSAVALALGLRLLCALFSSPTPRDDAVYYVAAAQDLASGLGYLLHGKPTAYWPVGYPFFLSVVFQIAGPNLLVAKLIQSVLSVAIVYMSYWLARHIYGRENPARFAAVLLALMPSQIAFPSLMLGEVLYTALTLAGFVCIVRPPRWLWVSVSGVCFALAVFVRPVALLLPIIGLLWARAGTPLQKLRSAAVIYGVVFCVTLPWTLRNIRALHHPIWVSTNAGINFWMGNHPGATGAYRFTPEMENASIRIEDEVEFDSYARARAFEFIHEHPADALLLMARKAIVLWGSDRDGIGGAFPRNRSWQRKVFEPLSDLAYVGVWALLIGAIVLRRKVSLIAVAVLLYYTIVYAVTVAAPRYHCPAIPWLVIAAAAVALPPGSAALGRQSQRREQSG